MKKSGSSNSFGGVDFLFSSLLFLMFVLCAVFTILIGSRVYENIRARDDDAFYSDTALAYIANKVRQADSFDSVSLRYEPLPGDGSPAKDALPDESSLPDKSALSGENVRPERSCGVQVLVFSSNAGDTVYETWIYHMDGTLRELYTEKDSGLTINDGLEIMKCPSFSFSLEEAVNGRTLSIFLETGKQPARLLLRSKNLINGTENENTAGKEGQ